MSIRRCSTSAIIAILAGLFLHGTVFAQVSQKCEAAKNKAVGKYSVCLQKAFAKYAQKGDADKFDAAVSRCKSKFEKVYGKAESKAASAGGSCPTSTDVLDFESYVAGQSGIVASALAGSGLPRCGNGIVDRADEQCDGGDLDASDCGFFNHDGGVLGCTGGCRFDASACITCNPGQTYCSSCTDLLTDDNNCGSCGNLCAANERCSAGSCAQWCVGDMINGVCWFFASAGQSCADKCSVQSLSYDPATDVDQTTCESLGVAFGHPTFGVAIDMSGNMGCFYNGFDDTTNWDISGADAVTASGPLSRYCACY